MLASSSSARFTLQGQLPDCTSEVLQALSNGAKQCPAPALCHSISCPRGKVSPPAGVLRWALRAAEGARAGWWHLQPSCVEREHQGSVLSSSHSVFCPREISRLNCSSMRGAVSYSQPFLCERKDRQSPERRKDDGIKACKQEQGSASQRQRKATELSSVERDLYKRCF